MVQLWPKANKSSTPRARLSIGSEKALFVSFAIVSSQLSLSRAVMARLTNSWRIHFVSTRFIASRCENGITELTRNLPLVKPRYFLPMAGLEPARAV
jgi:hypothetical protein